MKNILITGGCGFLKFGVRSNDKRLLVGAFDNLSRLGSKENYEWIKKRGNVSL